MATLRKINDIKVRPVQTISGGDARKALGYRLFPEAYSNIFLCARRKSGKSSLIAEIIKRCAGKTTTVMVFCSTVQLPQRKHR